MKKKIMGITLCMFMIVTVVPMVEAIDIDEKYSNQNIEDLPQIAPCFLVGIMYAETHSGWGSHTTWMPVCVIRIGSGRPHFLGLFSSYGFFDPNVNYNIIGYTGNFGRHFEGHGNGKLFFICALVIPK